MNTDQTASTSKVPQLAVVGSGYWGKNLVRNFAELGALAVICDTDKVTRDAFDIRAVLPRYCRTDSGCVDYAG
jgi:hypothetical protein